MKTLDIMRFQYPGETVWESFSHSQTTLTLNLQKHCTSLHRK